MVPITYAVHGAPCSVFRYVKQNASTATYEVRLNDNFSFRVYVPFAALRELVGSREIPEEIKVFVDLPKKE